MGLTEVDGLLVRQVEAGSPAERSGVLIGDVLVSAGETALTTPEALLDALATAGETIGLHIVRGVEETTLEVVLTEQTTQA